MYVGAGCDPRRLGSNAIAETEEGACGGFDEFKSRVVVERMVNEITRKTTEGFKIGDGAFVTNVLSR